MRVMITGATTPLGAALVDTLLAQRDVELVLAIGRESEPLERRAHDRLQYRRCDLTHQRSLHDLLWGEVRSLGIDAVVHGMHHRLARDAGRAVHAQNVSSTRALVLACADHPTIRRLVYRSFAEVYALHQATTEVLDEESPLEFDPSTPQWLRDRVEADLTACAHLCNPSPRIAVLRCAEILAPASGSQLWDYLSSRVCLRPLGYDPILNVLSLEDAAEAFLAALRSEEIGVFNIPGFDTLPLSRAIAESVRVDIPIPGSMMSPMYKLRRIIAGFDFRYDMNVRRFHFGGVVDGTRALRTLGYAPRHPVQWPRPRYPEPPAARHRM